MRDMRDLGNSPRHCCFCCPDSASGIGSSGDPDASWPGPSWAPWSPGPVIIIIIIRLSPSSLSSLPAPPWAACGPLLTWPSWPGPCTEETRPPGSQGSLPPREAPLAVGWCRAWHWPPWPSWTTHCEVSGLRPANTPSYLARVKETVRGSPEMS